ncbi:hypothetical protein ES702_02656 [subsurface metagenome]
MHRALGILDGEGCSLIGDREVGMCMDWGIELLRGSGSGVRVRRAKGVQMSRDTFRDDDAPSCRDDSDDALEERPC